MPRLPGRNAVLDKLGLDWTMPDTGCCGMAGSFGYEKDKYAVSIAAGERRLLPAVRQCYPDTLIVIDGLSCREQIWHKTGQETLNLVHVLHKALS